MIDNRDLSLYLMDGTYEGCIRYEYDGYNLVAYKIPRDDFSRIKNDPESGILSNSSIYLLFGKRDNQPTVYVGQAAARKNGNAALQRIPEPHGDKDWADAVILTTNDDHLDRSALCYLENLFYRMIKEAGSYIITNSAEPSSDNSIKQKDIRILAKYVEHATILVQVMGFNAFKKKVETSKLEKPTKRIIPDTIDTETIYYCKQRGANASGHRTENDGFIVLKGSIISSMQPTSSCTKTTKANRQDNISKIDGHTLTEDIVFASPSAASNFVMFANTSGNREWMTADKIRLGDARDSFDTVSVRMPKKAAGVMQLFCTDRGANAVGCPTEDGKFIVKKGSMLTTLGPTNSCPDSAKKAYNDAKDIIRGNQLIEDVIFNSASAASNFVLLASTNGNDRWHTEDGVIYGKLK